ncbi:helix-turn-helix domain-containing protein [Floccifex sp.]|uniref:helix-turn-helix domain-containing protein n=1 Tax=Floccifex sp. TaxID=2815810 RepID=UPI003F0888D3
MASYKNTQFNGDALKKIIADNNLTVTQFSKEIELNRVTVQQYISGKLTPSKATIQKIADYFDLPVEYFTGEPFDSKGNAVNLIESLSDLAGTKIEEHNLNQSFKSAIKAANFTFEKSNTDTKVNMALQIYDVVREAQEGPRLKNITSADQNTQLIGTPLDELEMIFYEIGIKNINQLDIRNHIFDSLNGDRIIPASDWKSYKEGFTDAVAVTISYKSKVLNDLNKNDFKELCKYKEKVVDLLQLSYLAIPIHHMNSSLEYIKQAIEIYQNDLYPDLLDVSYKNRIMNGLRNINDDLFEIAVKPLLDMLNGEMDSFILDLEKYKEKIEEQLDIARSNLGIK